MTYCVAITVQEGIVFCSDSRTSSGVDQINTYSKMYRFPLSTERQYVILSAGNLATTQAVINQVKKDIDQKAPLNLGMMSGMHDAAEYLGELSRQQQAKTGGGPTYHATFVLGGQIIGNDPQLMLVYAEGNYITTSPETQFLQIGESKYGKPILDRIIRPDTSLQTAALCALVSMDSTMRSNLSVGPPIELLLYRTNSFLPGEYYHLKEDSVFLKRLTQVWNEKLIEGFQQLPPLENATAAGSPNEAPNPISGAN
jgi:putative proteasome-type protease